MLRGSWKNIIIFICMLGVVMNQSFISYAVTPDTFAGREESDVIEVEETDDSDEYDQLLDGPDMEVEEVSPATLEDNMDIREDASEMDVVAVELPLVNGADRPFDFILDPYKLTTVTHMSAHGNVTFEEDKTLYFKNSQGSYHYSSKSDRMTIVNKGTVPVKVTLKASLKNYDGIFLAETPYLLDEKQCSIYMALLDDNGNVVPFGTDGSAEIIYEMKAAIQGEDPVYDSYSFGLTGACKGKEGWDKLSEVPKVQVTWVVEPVFGDHYRAENKDVPEEDSVSDNGILEDSVSGDDISSDIDVDGSVSDAAVSDSNVSGESVSDDFIAEDSVADSSLSVDGVMIESVSISMNCLIGDSIAMIVLPDEGRVIGDGAEISSLLEADSQKERENNSGSAEKKKAAKAANTKSDDVISDNAASDDTVPDSTAADSGVSVNTAPENVAADSGVSANTALENKEADSEVSDITVPENKAADGEVSANTASENKAADGEVSANTASENKAADDGVSADTVSDNKAADGEVSANTASENKAADGGVSANTASENKAADGEVSDNTVPENMAADSVGSDDIASDSIVAGMDGLYDIMSASEEGSRLRIHDERRMAIMNEVHDIVDEGTGTDNVVLHDLLSDFS